jgi:serine/threonine protein phosphatase PrpC
LQKIQSLPSNHQESATLSADSLTPPKLSWEEEIGRIKCNLNSFGCRIHPPELTSEIRFDLEEIKRNLGENVALAYGDIDTAGLTKQGSDHPVNQDRGVVISPFMVENSQVQLLYGSKDDFLIGIFDGHGTLGHEVSQYLQDHLHRRISMKLSTLDSWSDDNVKRILNETFVEIDAQLPEKIGMDGGSTASIILRLGRKLFFANVGDSLSFLAKCDKHTGVTTVVHRNRFDKPNIPEEKTRIEKVGGKVFIPQHPINSRVVAFSPVLNEMVSLGMSRSIGDWSHGKVGVIAEPIVDIINLDQVLSSTTKTKTDENIGLLVVSGSDGLFDRRRQQFVAENYSKCFFGPEKCHPVVRTAELIDSAVPKAANVYHDDITAMVLRVKT